MAWFRGDDHSHTNHKLLAVGLVGTGLHFRAISWCASEESDGRVPVSVLASLSPELTPKARQALVKRMVESGLWEPMPDLAGNTVAYEIHDYLTYNPSRTQLAAKRTKERQRLNGRRGSG